MSINKRLFGSTIPKKVQKKLEARQRVAGSVTPGESLDGTKMIDGVFPDKDGNVQADLSSRTPFVRMWTSVKLIEPGYVGKQLEQITAEEYDDFEKLLAFNIPVPKVDKFRTEYPKLQVIAVEDPDGEPMPGMQYVSSTNNADPIPKYKFYIAEKGVDRDQVDFTRKIYEIGNHAYQEKYGEVTPGEPLIDLRKKAEYDQKNWAYKKDLDIKRSDPLYEVFPHELKTNPLMKPQTGITKVTTETEGTLGVIKKTTIDFVVHNFYDYDRIFNKYFLRPGATIFVDFGWSSVKSLYNPEDLVDDDSEMEIFLYGDTTKGDSKNGVVTKNQGDLEVLQGIVTDYNAKITQNGSVECSVTITSQNSALLSFKTDGDTTKRIKAILERGILYLGVYSVIEENNFGDDLKQLMNTPNHGSDATEIQTYNANLRLLAAKLLAGDSDGVPYLNSVRTGVYINNFSLDDNYISFGLFEDLIINSQFGFGKNIDDIETGRNSQVKLNSSNSFASYNVGWLEAQKQILPSPEDAPIFLYPKEWGFHALDVDGDERPDSYSFQKNKYPSADDYPYPKEYMPQSQGGTGEKSHSEYDISLGRIPLREIFINIDVIVEAFEQNDNVKKVLKQICDTISENSQNILKLKLIKGDNDSEVKIIDENFLNNEEVNAVFSEENFTFNIMSPNSIVKDYNLEFKLPSGNIGNMYAIQGASHGDNLFSVDEGIVNSKALSKQYGDSLSVIYEPDLGNFRLQQLLENKNNSDIFDVYNQVNKLISNNIYSVDTWPVNEQIEGSDVKALVKGDVVTKKEDITTSKENKSVQNLIKINQDKLKSIGVTVAQSLKEYHSFITGQTNVLKTPRLLPYTLSLTTYGIASVNPGDTFEVDYLPKMYLKDTYLQIMKVMHNVGTDGWYTTFDTQFRLKSYTAVRQEAKGSVSLSPNVVLNYGLAANQYFLDWALRKDKGVTISSVMNYVQIMRPLPTIPGLDLYLEFTTSEKLSDEIAGGRGRVYANTSFQVAKNCPQTFNDDMTMQPTYGELKLNYFYRMLKSSGFGSLQGDDLSTAKYTYKTKKAKKRTRYVVTFPDIYFKPNTTYRLLIKGNRYAFVDPNVPKFSEKWEDYKKLLLVKEPYVNLTYDNLGTPPFET